MDTKRLVQRLVSGTDKLKLLVSTSIEEGDQYEDGNGNTFMNNKQKEV